MYLKLRALRKQKGFSSSEMAKRLHIAQPYYSQLETRKRNLSYQKAIEIAHVFNMKPDEIFYDDHLKNGLK